MPTPTTLHPILAQLAAKWRVDLDKRRAQAQADLDRGQRAVAFHRAEVAAAEREGNISLARKQQALVERSIADREDAQAQLDGCARAEAALSEVDPERERVALDGQP